MARLSGEQLEALKQKYGVNEIWSWSKVDKFIISPYEYYLKYVKHVKEDRIDCAYAPLGGLCHSILESLYKGELKYGEMCDSFNDGWLINIDVSNLKFDRNDDEKNDRIGTKYKACLDNFFQNHVQIDNKIVLEQCVSVKVGDHLFQGYIDAVFKDDDGVYHIIDWKTSTKYSGKTMEEKCGQLTLYGLALLQRGVPINQIKIGWNFLKYATIEYQQKNGAIKTCDVERNKIGERLQTNAGMWLKHHGYSESDIELYLAQLAVTNSIDVLPSEIRDKYTVCDCYVYVPFTQRLVDKWTTTIVDTIADIKAREKLYAETENDMAFWDTDDSVKAQSYYFATLCGYSPNLHKPYKAYLDQLDQMQNSSIYSGVGSELQDEVVSASHDDMSWLDALK